MMGKKLFSYLKGRTKTFLGLLERKRIVQTHWDLDSMEDSRSWTASLSDPSTFYKIATSYYEHRLGREFQEHRRYFKAESRGFGEDAFHTMWYLLCREFKIKNFLEIGVYRGQALSLVSLLQTRMGIEGAVTGISPFLPAGDQVSTYLSGIEYQEDTLANFRHFSLPEPRLIKAFSTDPEAVEAIASVSWDCVYIDGNHDYEVALSDWNHCSRATKVGGLIVLDDSGLTTSYKAPLFATAGHPGPSRLASEIDRTRFEEILQVGHNRVFRKKA